MVFLKNDWTYVTLEWAKDDLKGWTWPQWPTWPKGDKWDKGDKGDKWDTWADWVHIVSAAFNGNDIDFTESDW
jgi:hypothetical protein